MPLIVRSVASATAAFLALLAWGGPSAHADVLVHAPNPSVACGGTITTGVWYQSYSGGSRKATIAIRDGSGRRLFHRDMIATTDWRYFRYRAACGRLYRVRYVAAGRPITFRVRVDAQRASSPSRAQAQRAARQAASRKVDSYGITYRPSAWSAACSRAASVWACRVATAGGQCAGRLTIYGTARHPKARNIQIGCGE
jgi:hypothetical protein